MNRGCSFEQVRRSRPRPIDADWLVLKGLRAGIAGMLGRLTRPGGVALDSAAVRGPMSNCSRRPACATGCGFRRRRRNQHRPGGVARRPPTEAPIWCSPSRCSSMFATSLFIYPRRAAYCAPMVRCCCRRMDPRKITRILRTTGAGRVAGWLPSSPTMASRSSSACRSSGRWRGRPSFV